jgi:localization factor PodJL
MQDRIDAAERVKQLADAAFTSAADALAQSARDQSKAFESLETTVRSVQKRIVDIETGQADWPGKDSIGRLELALGQLQKRIGDLDSDRADRPTRDTILRLESTLGQLQKRLMDMEAAAGNSPGKDSLARLEASITSMRGEVIDADRRTRDDITQMAKFMRDLGTRVDNVERGGSVSESITARFDSLEARSSSMFDEIRGQMSALDSRIAQASSNKNSIPPAAFAALKGSVEGIAARLDDMGDQGSSQPLVNSIHSIEAKLGALASKIEQSDMRTSESVGGVNAALKTISSRIEDSDKRQSQAINVLSRRMDESDQRTELSARDIHKSLGDFAERIDMSDKRNKDAMSGLRLTVDGLVARGVADAVPQMRQDPMGPGTSSANPSALSTLQGFSATPPSYVPPPPLPDSDLPPFLRTPNTAAQQRGYSSEGPPPPPPPAFDDPDGDAHDGGYSLSALQTILANTLSQQPPEMDEGKFAPDPFDPSGDDPSPFADPTDRPNDFLAQARRAAQAAAERDMDRPLRGKRGAMTGEDQGGKRNFGRLAVIALAGVAVVTGIVAVLFTLPGGTDDGVERPDPGSSIGEMMNGHSAPPVPPSGANSRVTPQDVPGADFAPLPPASETGAANGAPAAMAAPPNGMGVPTQPDPTGADFTAGTSALPGTTPKEAVIASLESGAVRGDAKAQYLLSLRYSDGRGVVKDDARAASLVTKSAQQGLAVAQYRLGSLYERGVGVDKNLGSAKEWYEKAAKLGNRKAMHNLAVLMADSTAGQPNYKEAAFWFHEGATYGLTDSQYNVAILLEQGWGVQKNLKEATTWYAIAANQGDSGAAERLEALKKTLPAPDIALALDAARKFKPKPMNPVSNDTPSGPG